MVCSSFHFSTTPGIASRGSIIHTPTIGGLLKYASRLTTALLLGGALALTAGTDLSKAIKDKDLGKAKACMAAGEKVNELDKWGWTPLHWAVYNQFLPGTEFLLTSGADPNVQAEQSVKSLAKGATPLVIAGYYGLADHAALLMKKGAKPELADANGKTALTFARQYQFTEVEEVITGKVSKANFGAGVNDAHLAGTYPKVMLEPFTTTPEIAKDYTAAVRQCEEGAMFVLKSRKGFEQAELAGEGKTAEAGTLLVKVQITELRIASAAARMWAGAFAGNSYVRAKVTLVDPASGKVEREQLLTTENNAMGAAWTMGASDRSIPKDLGAIIGGYLITVAGQQ
jgi:hypothetical protein